MLFDAVYLLFMVTGNAINVLALVANVLATPKSLRDYSIIIFNTSLNDLILMILHSLIHSRFFLHGPTLAMMTRGPCLIVSDSLCLILFGLTHATALQTCSIVGISFWYRHRTLRVIGDVGWCKLQSAILLAWTPHIPHLIFFLNVVQPREFFEPIVDLVHGVGSSKGYWIYGFVNTFDPSPAAYCGYIFIFPIVIYAYIFFTRRAVLRALSANAVKMSSRTHEMHQSLVKLLTIHALLPGCIIFAFILMFLQMAEFMNPSEESERIFYMIGVFPAIVNPILTIYFIKPYRKFLCGVLPCEARVLKKNSTMASTTASKPSLSYTRTDY